MLYVFLSISCSVVVSVMLKLAKRYQIDIYQAITWNYSIAALLTWLFFRPSISSLQDVPIYNYAALGILFPLLFVIMATSVKWAGIVRTDVAQRLSLFIPIVASFFIFGEAWSTVKIIGLILAFAAIIFSFSWKTASDRSSLNEARKGSWLYLILVFLGFGVIDVMLKQLTKVEKAPFTTVIFFIFILSFILCIIGLIYLVATKKARFSWPHIFIGWTLGVFNFGNIIFYLKAHQVLANSPSTVFSAMNIGVIVAGTLVGILIFKEKLSTLNKIGIVIAVLAIIIIYFPQTLNFLHI